MLIDITLCENLFHTAPGTAFVDIIIAGHRETWPIRSKRFRSFLRRCDYHATGEAASAAELLEARAQFDGPERDFRGGVFNDVVPGFGVVPESVDFRANVVRAGLNYKFDWYRPFVTR
jgi:hypothetical protein